jgi:GT2 family glycosyltransferase
MQSVAAIIPTWNTAKYMERCLDSLANQDGVNLETMVIDNGSTDASLALIERRGVPHVALESNIGSTAAVNLGVSNTSAPLVMVLNADCFLARGCLRALVAALDADDGLGGVQPRILQDGGTEGASRIFSVGQCLARNGAAFERGWGEPDGPRYAERREVFGVSGAACLLRRKLFTDLGGYDAAYFAFFEDVDLNARARLAGWRFAYLPDAVAIHVGHAAWSQAPRSARFNVELTVRNRLATAVKVLPVRGVLGSLSLTLRSLVASPMHGTTTAVVRGTMTVIRWAPRLLGERRKLRRQSTQALDGWLAKTQGPGADPSKV